jgi:hypothetical protein
MRTHTKDTPTDTEETWTRLDVAASNWVMLAFRKMHERKTGVAETTPAVSRLNRAEGAKASERVEKK